MIYLDNAATGGYKPRSVTDAVENVVRYLSSNPGRSGHRLSLSGAELIHNCRKICSEIFNCPYEKVIFTKNCTEALNTAIFGTIRKGGHVITTTFEHNSVLRPLTHLKNLGNIALDVVSPTKDNDLFSAISTAFRDDTVAVISSACSNVTGEFFPIEKIGNLCLNRGALFIVDGAQAGGHVNLDMKKNNISALCLAGHKGLYGIMGSGLLLISEDTDVSPLIYGGTGTESYNLSQPDCYPEKLESGTINLPAIASLNEGVRYAYSNLETFGNTVYNHTKYLLDELSLIKGVRLYSNPNRAGIVSFNLEKFQSSEVADILNCEYDIALRAGLHCAPLTHRFLKTEKEGLVRASISVHNSTRELAFFLRAVKNIVNR